MATAPLTRTSQSDQIAASVVVCAYTVDRWPDLQRAVASVVAQDPPPAEVIVVVDHNTELLERASGYWALPVNVIANAGGRGLSGARNTGVNAAGSEIVAFLDDDAEAQAGWLGSLLDAYADPNVAACGGAAVAALAGTRPTWWPLEFDWIVGCSYVGLPTATSEVRNLIGANMSVRRAMVVELGGFPEGIGRVGTSPVGCEETDLFIRLARRWPESRILYEPTATVRHSVPQARLSWSYFRARCFAEGISKAKVAARVGNGPALASEKTYTMKVLPLGFAKGVFGACRGESGAGRRALAITAGLAMTTVGYVWGKVAARLNGAAPQPLP